ncbi:MAG TPA: hypothetical protein VFV38_40880 [Ktedonobacteraceae bacterium]|nr:hypothetical protein [Ktedonobacteraceae bacterium]
MDRTLFGRGTWWLAARSFRFSEKRRTDGRDVSLGMFWVGLTARQHASTPGSLGSIDNRQESLGAAALVSSSCEAASRLALGAIVVAAQNQDGLTDGLRGQFRRLAGLSGAVDGIWWTLPPVWSTSIHNFWLYIVERPHSASMRPAQPDDTHTYVAKKRVCAAYAVFSARGPVFVDAPLVNRASLNTLVEVIQWMGYIWLVWLSWLIGWFFFLADGGWLVASGASDVALTGNRAARRAAARAKSLPAPRGSGKQERKG